ncbi:hypothetical protein [Nostoc sp.]|uniref:hypothetical protein n=1 Tax=Nostoc sp. TaxID=1180 RepID=UPI002FF50CC9
MDNFLTQVVTVGFGHEMSAIAPKEDLGLLPVYVITTLAVAIHTSSLIPNFVDLNLILNCQIRHRSLFGECQQIAQEKRVFTLLLTLRLA